MDRQIALQETYGHFIGGQWVEPANHQYFEGVDPSTGNKIASFARGNKEDIERAVRSSEEGFQAWYALKPSARGQILNRVAQLLRKYKQDFAYMETIDTGRPLVFSASLVETSARYFEYLGGAADKIFGEVIPASNEHLTYTYREPYGITGHITPWNVPITQAARGAASALAAGNSVVMKPAEQACLSTLELAKLCVEAGMPPGTFNVVTGYGEEAGAPLINHPAVRKIAFTGSVETGQIVMRAAADRIVPVSLELGGKSPNIVFDDADLHPAAAGSLRAFTFNTGQVCSAGTRLIVQRSILPAFVEQLIEEAQQIKIGYGIDNPTIGPLVCEEQLHRVLRYVEIGKQEGARLVYGGSRMQEEKLKDGYFMQPTIFTDVTNTMTIAREEIFGPVVVVIPFDTEEEAIRLANDTEFGLAAAVWTENIHRGHRVAKQLQAGQVYINDYSPIDVEAPFGGYKKSGIGREKGLESLHTYTQVKAVSVKL
ncbi:aldehyde dehydrogenase [Paenibacillus sp. tmac-D7]|uniref:aldehyde dehydrogenase family protein n=1 Tax=Paenibacillus sp. tmac-D7 TaxID=2591462 RepID=UPI001C640163|nr:aldehyde dehydrogenase family protein [Paenibacillus sp. tmac-D7]